MGKLSRKKTFDGKTSDDKQQRKISSFFENKPPNKQGPSKLFTSISESKKLNTVGSTCHNDKTSSISSRPSSTTSRTASSTKSVNNSSSLKDDTDVICIDDNDIVGEKVKDLNNIHNNDHPGENLSPAQVESGDARHGRVSVKSIGGKFGERDTILPKVLRSTENSKSHESCNSHTDTKKIGNVLIHDVDDDEFIDGTPTKPTQTQSARSSLTLSPDVICNTPNVDGGGGGGAGGGMRFKSKPGGRSFLRPFHLVTKQPDLKPAEMNTKRKLNKVSGAVVSVSFTSNNSSDVSKSKCLLSEDIANCDGKKLSSCGSGVLCSINDTHGEGEVRVKSNVNGNNADSFESVHNVISQSDGLLCVEDSEHTDKNTDPNQFVSILPKPSPKSVEGFENRGGNSEVGPSKIREFCNENTVTVTGVDCSKENGTGNDVHGKPTPTKIYHQSDLAEMIKVKRMAKSGLSPQSKRPMGGHSTEVMEIDLGCDDNDDISNVDSGGVEKARRHLDLNSDSDAAGITMKNVAYSAGLSTTHSTITNNVHDFSLSTMDVSSGEGMTNLLSLPDNNFFNADLLSIDNCGTNYSSKQKNSAASVLQQKTKSSKKFTVKQAEALGWKGTAKSKSESTKVTLEDDDVLDELMLDLNSSPAGGAGAGGGTRDTKSSKISKSSKKEKMKSADSFDSKRGGNLVNGTSNFNLPSDDVFRSLGMDLPGEIDGGAKNQQMHSTANRSSNLGSVAEKNSHSSSEKSKAISGDCQSSNQKRQSEETIAGKQSGNVRTSSYDVTVAAKKKEMNSGDFGLLNDSEIDSLMLAALDDEEMENKESKEPTLTGSEDLASSFKTLSPFKKPQERAKKVETSSSSKSEFRFSDLWQRFKVKEANYDSNSDEKRLTLCGENDLPTSLFFCTLRGFWVDTKVSEGDVVNVIGNFDDSNRCTIDDKSGILVVSPDLLLSGTSVVSSVFCARKSVLNEKFKGLDQGNAHMLYGSIIHSLFQAVLKDNVRKQEEMMHMARALLAAPKFLHAMYSLGVTEAAVLEEIKQYIPPLMAWLDTHMAVPRKGGGVGSAVSSRSKKPSVVVTDIQDIEENIWSPRFGVKGKIDLTVKAKLQDENGLMQTKVVPLELKTGRASFSSEHKGQVTLYSMMYGDRRGDPGEGLLLYLKTGQMETVQVKPQSMSGLIQLRNNLASFFKDQISQRLDEAGHMTYSLGPLPPPISNQRACDKCAHLLNCCLYQRSVESDATLGPSHPMVKLVPETLSHLDPEALTYFTHWVTCLQMEEQQSNQRHLGPIWNMGSMERERKGDCLSHLLIQSSELGIQESQGFNEGKGCSLTFVRHHGYQGNPSLDTVGLIVNDAVVVSSEDGRLIALATGFIRTLSETHVEVIVDRDNLYDIGVYKNILFRLDRNTSFSTSAQLMANLTRLMENTPHASRLRQLVIHKCKPQSEMKIPMAWVRTMKPVFKDLNKPQKTAILKVLMSTDYTVIRGFPGTGKTSIIVALVKVLQLLGKSVLLTSYTHSAVDNILLKLKRDDVPFLRLGRQARIHPTIRPHAAEILTSSIPSVEELKKFYYSYTVIATSCLGVSHTLFNHRRFDVCIVDEASQVLQPACLGPIFHCQKFVLVGDSQQLAPVVQSKGARSLQMDESLFLRLEDGGATYDLHLQYRMNKVIMAISNSLVYKGKLECGSQDVASQCLNVELSKLEGAPDWMKATLNPELSKSVVFLDTQKAASHNTGGEGRSGIQNEFEASVVVALLQTLHKASVSTADVGVISPYRSQVKLLQRKVQGCPLVAGVEVNTVDQYQGRDKSVIIVSFALSDENAADSAGELLKDVRRLNVAVTRARHKLILLGNASTLTAWPHLHGIMTDLQAAQCMIQIPPSVSFPMESPPIKS